MNVFESPTDVELAKRTRVPWSLTLSWPGSSRAADRVLRIELLGSADSAGDCGDA